MKKEGFNFNLFKKTPGQTLKAVGESLDTKIELTRREVVAGGAALFAGGALTSKVLDNVEDKHEDSIAREGHAETGELFERQQTAFTGIYGSLTAHQIQFLDTYAGPLGGPYTVEPLHGVSPGPLNDEGVITGPFNPRWLQEARKDVLERHPEVQADISKDEPRQTNTIALLRIANKKNPELHAKTLLDVVRFYGDKKVNGIDENLTRIEYIKKYIGQEVAISPDPIQPNNPFRKFDLPKSILAELKRIVPGLAAQESQFNNESFSSAGARGIFQFMPDTWEDTFKRVNLSVPNDDLLKNQLEGVTLYFLHSYHEFLKRCPEALTRVKMEFFDGDEDAFDKYFFTPILINSYNSGTGRLASVLSWFLQTFPSKEALRQQIGSYPDGFGYDVYATMAHEARARKAIPGYGNDSSEYVTRSMAFATLLEKP